MNKKTINLELSREQFANLIGKLELLAELTTQPKTAEQTKRLQTDLLALAYPRAYKKTKLEWPDGTTLEVWPDYRQ